MRDIILKSAILLILFSLTLNATHAAIFDNLINKVKSLSINNENNNIVNDEENFYIDPNKTKLNSDTPSAIRDEDMAFEVQIGSLRTSLEDPEYIDDKIYVYEVKKGDTVAQIAKLYKVSANTIVWANDLQGKNVKEGDVLLIMPMTGVTHKIKKGDTVLSVVKKYKANLEDVEVYNGITENTELNPGDTLFIPEGEIEAPAPAKQIAKTNKPTKKYSNNVSAGYYMRPVIGCTRTQGIHGHNGIDIACPVGTSILAMADGKVISAKMGGWNGGYGSMIIISHPNGTQTLYGHLSNIFVTTGDNVRQGQVIGAMGSSGKSTGPHLHFEVRGAINPF